MGFLTVPPYSLKEAHQIVLFQKITFGVIGTPCTPIFTLQTSRADWDQNPKVGNQKLEKCEGGCVRYRDPIFLNEKSQEVR